MNIDPYYTLDKIPIHRQELIELKVKQFIRKNNIKKWPLDLVQIILNIVENGKMPISIKSMELSNKVDALTIHVAGINIYQIFVNRNRINYPFKASKDRRLNFTLAHEIGHICLGHIDLPDSVKTKEDKNLEDLEADEFAGRLLMPTAKIMNINYHNTKIVAEHFNVSESAVLKRLSNLKLHSIRKSKLIPVCEDCGNSEIHTTDEFCIICGSYIKDRTMGVSKMNYMDGVKINEESNRVINCPVCDNRDIHEDDEFCNICGTSVANECTSCKTYAETNARFCRFCGSKTLYYELGLLENWKIAHEGLLNRIEYELSLSNGSNKVIPLDDWDNYVWDLYHSNTEPLFTLLESSMAFICGETLLVYVTRDKYKDIILSTSLISELKKLLPNYFEIKLTKIEVKTLNDFYLPVKKEAEEFEIPF